MLTANGRDVNCCDWNYDKGYLRLYIDKRVVINRIESIVVHMEQAHLFIVYKFGIDVYDLMENKS